MAHETAPPPAPAPGPPSRPPPAPRAPRARRFARFFLALLGPIAVLAALAAAAGWLVTTESGLRATVRLAAVASGGALRVEAPAGRLLGPLAAAEVRFETADLRLRIRGFALDWQPAALGRGAVRVRRLAADEVEIASRPRENAPPPTPPAGLTLPFALGVERLAVGRLALRPWDGEAGAPDRFAVSDIFGRLASDGRHHRLEMLGATLPFGRAALAGELDGTSPFALAARGALTGEQGGREWRADLSADGDLLAPRLVAEARGAGLSGRAEAFAAPFAAVPLRRLRVALGEIDPAAFAAAAPHAALHLQAELAPAGNTLDELVGPVRIDNRRPQTADRGGLPVSRLAAELRWTPAELAATSLAVDLLGKGTITGSLRWRPPAAGPQAPPPAAAAAASPYGRLVAALELAGIDAHRLDARLPSIAVAGRLDAEGDDRRQTAAVALTAGKARVEARGELVMAAAAPGGATPGAPSFTLAAKLRDFDPRSLVAAAPRALLNLDLDGRGRLGAAPTAQGTFRLADSRFLGRPLAGEGRIAVERARLADADFHLELAGNRLTARGAWGGRGDRLAIEVDAPVLGALGEGFSGRARLDGTLAGTPAEPAGTVRFFAERLVLPGKLRLAGANGEAELDAGLDGPFRLAVGVSGLGPTGEAAEWVSAGRFTVDGTRRAHRAELAAEGPQGDAVELALEGGLVEDKPAGAAAPALRWSGRLAALRSTGRFAARLVAPAALEVGARALRLGRAEIEAGTRGRITLEETQWSPEEARLRGRLAGLALDLAAQPAGRGRRGPTPLTLGAQWDLRLGDSIDGEARVFREAGDLVVGGEMPARLGLDRLEASLTARAGRLAAELAARGSELGELEASFSARAERAPGGGWRLAPEEALAASAHLAMPSIAWVGRLTEENLDTAGSLEASFAVSGTPARPTAAGTIRGHELVVRLPDQGLALAGGELVADFDRDRLRLTRLAFVSPNRVTPRDRRLPVAALTRTPGSLQASGDIALASGEGRFRFAADRLPLLQRADRWLLLSGRGTVRSTWTSAELDADLRADAGYVESPDQPPPSLSDDVVVLGREPQAPRTPFKLAADVRVELGEHFYLSALGVDTRLAGELRLRAAPGAPLAATGAISTVGGTFRGYGQRLSIERGQITFQGPLDNPALNVVALRKGLDVEAGLAITGSARRPKVALVSEPPVPDPEKLSWLVLGRPPDAASGGDLGLLLPAAQALLGGPGGGITDQLSRSLGLDQLSIGEGELTSSTRAQTSRVVGGGTTVTGEGTVSGQVLSLGKRLSTDLFLSFEQSLGGAESLVKLSYQLGRRVALVARGGTDNALDLYYTFSFR